MDFLTLKPKSFGLDFSDLSLKAANLKKKKDFLKLVSWGEKELKPGLIEEGEIKDEKAVSQAIRELLEEIKGEKIKTKNVIASLPEKKAFFQVIRMPKMKKEELETAVPFEAENYIPLPIEEAYLDFQIVPSPKGYSDRYANVLLAAIPKTIVDPYVSCLKGAGLFPYALEIESQSIVRALIKNGVSAFPLLIIDFGKSTTSLIIFYGCCLRFTSSITISSHMLTQSIAQYLGIDFDRAEEMKLKYGLEVPSRKLKNDSLLRKVFVKGKSNIFEATKPTLNNLITEINKYLDYYRTHSKDGISLTKEKEIKKVILCGRGANLKGLPDFISKELKISVEIGNPWVNILSAPLKEIPELSFKESLGYTSALGLALRGVK